MARKPFSILLYSEAVEKIPTLKKLYSEVGSPFLQSQPKMSYARDGWSEALTFLNSDKRSSNITFFGASFRSARVLVHNMIHEFGHAHFNYIGRYQFLIDKHGQYSSIPLAYSEVYAFNFAFNHGGIPFGDNAWYLKNYSIYSKHRNGK